MTNLYYAEVTGYEAECNIVHHSLNGHTTSCQDPVIKMGSYDD